MSGLVQVGTSEYNQMAATVDAGVQQHKVISYAVAAAILLLAPGAWKLAAAPVAFYAYSYTGGAI